MVDATTLIVISTIVQTIVITITLIVFLLQFRSQVTAIKEASIQGLMGRYNDLIGHLADKPDVAKLLLDTMPGGRSASKEEAAVWGHMLMAYGIIEEAYQLYAKKWIDETNWLQWSAFLEVLAKNPLFVAMQQATVGTFDTRFEAYVRQILSKRELKSVEKLLEKEAKEEQK